MVNTGSRERRVKDALTNIGPAVLNGGFSTFLAFILLATSKSHVFTSFFKVNQTKSNQTDPNQTIKQTKTRPTQTKEDNTKLNFFNFNSLY